MNDTTISNHPAACLKLMLERNNLLFSEAHLLSCAALDLLERPYLDAEIFSQYQEKRKHADRKYYDAIAHLRLIMTQYQVAPCAVETLDHLSPSTPE